MAAPQCAAQMQEAIQQPTSSLEATDPIVAAALRAEAWAGEPFLRDGEDPAEALAEGTARRRALDDAIAEMDAGQKRPSSQWMVRYGLLLGLEPPVAVGLRLVPLEVAEVSPAHDGCDGPPVP